MPQVFEVLEQLVFVPDVGPLAAKCRTLSRDAVPITAASMRPLQRPTRRSARAASGRTSGPRHASSIRRMSSTRAGIQRRVTEYRALSLRAASASAVTPPGAKAASSLSISRTSSRSVSARPLRCKPHRRADRFLHCTAPLKIAQATRKRLASGWLAVSESAPPASRDGRCFSAFRADTRGLTARSCRGRP